MAAGSSSKQLVLFQLSGLWGVSQFGVCWLLCCNASTQFWLHWPCEAHPSRISTIMSWSRGHGSRIRLLLEDALPFSVSIRNCARGQQFGVNRITMGDWQKRQEDLSVSSFLFFFSFFHTLVMLLLWKGTCLGLNSTQELSGPVAFYLQHHCRDCSGTRSSAADCYSIYNNVSKLFSQISVCIMCVFFFWQLQTFTPTI